MNRPILGISMGDPFGNGPEITVKALADKTVYDRCRPVVIGDVCAMEYAARVAVLTEAAHENDHRYHDDNDYRDDQKQSDKSQTPVRHPVVEPVAETVLKLRPVVFLFAHFRFPFISVQFPENQSVS